MNNLKDLFEKRDETYSEQTEVIIEAIPHVLEGAKKFIQEREPTSNDPEWKDISLMEEGDGYVILIGTLEYNVGDMLQLPTGDMVEVSEDTADYFKRMLRIGIPLDLAKKGTEDEVCQFLIKTAEENEQADDEEQALIEAIQQAQQTVDEEEFDTESLTEEQKEQLRLFTLSNGGSSN